MSTTPTTTAFIFFLCANLANAQYVVPRRPRSTWSITVGIIASIVFVLFFCCCLTMVFRRRRSSRRFGITAVPPRSVPVTPTVKPPVAGPQPQAPLYGPVGYGENIAVPPPAYSAGGYAAKPPV